MHEASLYSQNAFVTLTYDDEHLPADRSLNYIHFQEFMKRLRERFSGSDSVSHPLFGQVCKKTGREYPEFYKPIRFYMCGEYGENRGRPHYHVCLFNFDFPDKKKWRKTRDGHQTWISDILKELWPYGFHEIGEVSYHSSAYVARYIMKKVNGAAAEQAYTFVDPVTGEVFERVPEFTKMSLKPGIGEGWFRRYMRDVFPNDYVIVNGRKCKPPRYYDNKYFEMTSRSIARPDFSDRFGIYMGLSYSVESECFDAVKLRRVKNALERVEDNTPERLYVRETVTLSKVSRLKRTLA